MRYNWQQADWPNFQYNLDSLQEILFKIIKEVGFFDGRHSALPENLQTEVMINLMVEEAIKTSEIEGEYISRVAVRSSIKNRLGLIKTPKPQDRKAAGISELMFDVRESFQEPLTEEKLCQWHLMLSSSFGPLVMIGRYRQDPEPMQVVSGHPGRWKVHFEAPASERVPKEMAAFLDWFNATAPGGPKAIQFAPVRSAIAHLYFESIHPFEDGNGRIGRAIAEKALSQGFGHPMLLSLSQSIEADKKLYYAALGKASQKNEITEWLSYFLNVIERAQLETELQINFVLKKSRFFDAFSNQLNARQMKVVKRMFKAGIKGFEGGMSAGKYMKIADTSKATATRDLQDLLAMQAFTQVGSGRSVRYYLNF